MFQAFPGNCCRDSAELFLKAAECKNQPPALIGDLRAAAMRAADPRDECGARQKVVNGINRVPSGLIAKPRSVGSLGNALVLHHGFEQSDTFAPDEEASSGTQG